MAGSRWPAHSFEACEYRRWPWYTRDMASIELADTLRMASGQVPFKQSGMPSYCVLNKGGHALD